MDLHKVKLTRIASVVGCNWWGCESGRKLTPMLQCIPAAVRLSWIAVPVRSSSSRWRRPLREERWRRAPPSEPHRPRNHREPLLSASQTRRDAAPARLLVGSVVTEPSLQLQIVVIMIFAKNKLANHRISEKTVPTYLLLLVCQMWSDFNKNRKDCPGINP